MNLELIITLAALALELGLFWLCFSRAKQPADPAKPRLIPYNLIMLFLTVGIFVTIAHTIGVVTGERIAPKTRMKGQ